MLKKRLLNINGYNTLFDFRIGVLEKAMPINKVAKTSVLLPTLNLRLQKLT